MGILPGVLPLDPAGLASHAPGSRPYTPRKGVIFPQTGWLPPAISRRTAGCSHGNDSYMSPSFAALTNPRPKCCGMLRLGVKAVNDVKYLACPACLEDAWRCLRRGYVTSISSSWKASDKTFAPHLCPGWSGCQDACCKNMIPCPVVFNHHTPHACPITPYP